jgi:hypothetical protein
MCGCLGWLNIPFNPANMIVLPLILGIGVDHGVHLVHLWRQQRTRFVLGDATTVALLLTASTTTASFGALILARHQGLQSLGQALTIGVTTCLAASIIFFPALLAWITRDRPISKEVHMPLVAATTPTPVATSSNNIGSSEQRREERPAAESSSEPMIPASIRKPAEAARIIEPAHVTEDEIAALLDTVNIPRRNVLDVTDNALLAESDVPNVATPRRRELPRRSEAA